MHVEINQDRRKDDKISASRQYWVARSLSGKREIYIQIKRADGWCWNPLSASLRSLQLLEEIFSSIHPKGGGVFGDFFACSIRPAKVFIGRSICIYIL
jgi:hypothetical protein